MERKNYFQTVINNSEFVMNQFLDTNFFFLNNIIFNTILQKKKKYYLKTIEASSIFCFYFSVIGVIPFICYYQFYFFDGTYFL